MKVTIQKSVSCSILVLACSLIFLKSLSATSVSSFDDITYWVGEGSNRAALAIDWFGDDASDSSLVWGYRWNDNATGEQMLRDVLADDDRFFAKISAGGPLGIATYGFGYDENNDSEFELDDATSFNAHGIAITSPSDGAETSEEDRYREGWSTGYWHYGLASTGTDGALNPWISSGIGPSLRQLNDGSWDSYAFAVTLNGNEFATNLIAAEPDVLNLAGDFNQDGSVDVADFAIWRDGFGTTYDQADYDDWLSNHGTSNNDGSVNGSLAASTTVPEPTTALLITYSLLSCHGRHSRRCLPGKK